MVGRCRLGLHELVGETGLLSREATDWLDGRYRGYKRGEVSELAICGEMTQVYQGLREEEMRRAAAVFFRTHIERHIFPEMRELIAALQQQGVDIWAVSSTNDWVIEEGVKRFQHSRQPGAVDAGAGGGRTGDGSHSRCANRRGQGDGAGAHGDRHRDAAAGRSLRQLGARCGDAGDCAACVSGESHAGTRGTQRV